jgi:hypothetical protein
VTRKRLLLLALALVLCLAAACEGETNALSTADLPRVVLQPSDLAGFSRFDEGRLDRADFQPGPRAERDRFGREDGWKARYRRNDPSSREGALVVVSLVDLFEDGDGAERDLEAYEVELENQGELVEAPKVGEESRAMTILQESQLTDVRFYVIAWRRANVTASVLVQGFEGTIEVDDALALARKQDGRIIRAAEQ